MALEVERRLAAIMFSDIMGYTALMARDEENARRARDRHEAVVRPLVERYQGEWIERTGDETLSTFPSALDAVNCALAVQAELRDDPELRLRIGIHQGDVTFDAGGISGDGVNIAARIRPLAEPGGVCVSEEVQHSLRGRTDLEFASLGTQELKNVGRPIAVFAVKGTAAPPRPAAAVAVLRVRTSRLPAALVAAALIALGLAGWWWARGGGELAPIRSIAVLPLENLSADPDQEFFADGMTEALIGDIAKIGSLRVISRTSVMRYKDSEKSLPEIARELNVDAVLEGTVMRAGDRVRISAQLIHAPTDRHLWAERYDREVRAILTLQSEIAQAIADQIRIELTPEERERLANTRRVDPEAHEAYLKGLYHWNQFTRESWNRAVDYHVEAIERDPGFALAYVGLAEAHNLLGSWHGDRPPREAYRLARAAAEKALEIDSMLAEAHAELAFAQFVYAWDWAGAEREFRRAIQLNPNSAKTRGKYAVLLNASGRFDEAEVELRRTLELNPLSPIAYVDLGDSYLQSGQYEKARQQALKAADLDLDFNPAYDLLGLVFWREGMPERAIEALRKAAELSGNHPKRLGELGYFYAAAGRPEEARRLLLELENVRAPGHVTTAIAKIHAGLGEQDLAFANLEEAIEEGNPAVVWLNFSPAFDPLRSDPRFLALLRRIGFPES
jgi:TolB-like protein/class 3 adenylate cyclase/Flp pilus assembly protein TadD